MKLKIISILLVAAFWACNTSKQETKKLLLPVIGEKKLAGVDGKDTIYHTVQSFSFVNQYHPFYGYGATEVFLK